jgi:Ca-activated chloride channel family protein
MHFANPHFLLGLLIIAALAAFYLWAWRKRKNKLQQFADKELLAVLLVRVDRRRQKIKIALLLVAVACCVLALMRPQWGFRWQEVKRRGLDIVIALDTSKSMLAQDVLPNRLQRSKLAIKDLVKVLKGDRIGLIAFAGTAFLECPLTLDYNGFMLSLDDISVNTIPAGGTSIASAIKEARRSYEAGSKQHVALIIITDGEDHEGDPLAQAEEAKKEGILIFCIGIGTQEGDLISLEEDNQRQFLKDKEGNVVKSRLDEALLQKIALATGGSYLRSTATEFGLDLLYRERLSKIEKRDFQSKMNKAYNERFQIPLGIALILLILEMFITDKRC